MARHRIRRCHWTCVYQQDPSCSGLLVPPSRVHDPALFSFASPTNLIMHCAACENCGIRALGRLSGSPPFPSEEKSHHEIHHTLVISSSMVTDISTYVPSCSRRFDLFSSTGRRHFRGS